nr:MAG TPA: hypothetical protein [Caudoviricetes sp.]
MTRFSCPRLPRPTVHEHIEKIRKTVDKQRKLRKLKASGVSSFWRRRRDSNRC